MTGKELLIYKMNNEEKPVWNRFCADIENKINILKLDPYAKEILADKLTKGTPYSYSCGYSITDGYYYVEAGDRGNWNLIFKSKSYEESWNEMLKKLARSIAYELTLKNGEEKKSVWEYDTKYDYRKYWFERALYILKETVSEDILCSEIKQYEELLNIRFSVPYWKYNIDKMEFVHMSSPVE